MEYKTIKINRNKIEWLTKKVIPMPLAIILVLNTSIGVALVQRYYYVQKINEIIASTPKNQTKRIEASMFPEEGIVLPVKWGAIPKDLVEIGVIDENKYKEVFKSGPLSTKENNYEEILAGNYDENIVLTKNNSRFVLNTLWALGLAQNSLVLSDMQSKYVDVSKFASTGGWSLGEEEAIMYYNSYNLVELTEAQQKRIYDIAANIYRPCCNNHTAFADCNHGMAMLGLVELMVAEGYNDDEIYDNALKANSMWFSDSYVTIARYMENERDTKWENVDSKDLLSADFSSATGFRKVQAQVEPVGTSGGGSSCAV